MELELNGGVAVVTGGSSGIGWACAESLAREGCSVAIWDLSADVEEKAAVLSHKYDQPSLGKMVDVSANDTVQAAMRETEANLGSISHLVHAAAIGSGKFGFPFTNLDPSDWTRVLDVNIMGMVNVAHAVAPGMIARRTGSMVFIASVAGQIGSQTDPPYSATKAANINFAQCLAKDLAPHKHPREYRKSGTGENSVEPSRLAILERSAGAGSEALLRRVGGGQNPRRCAVRQMADARRYLGHGGVSFVGAGVTGDRANNQC